MGLGIMLAGALVLRKGANLPPDLVGIFMLFTFLIVGMIEFMLVRNLSKLTGATDKTAAYCARHAARLPTTAGEPARRTGFKCY